MAFINVAIQKLNTLTSKSNFIGFISVSEDLIALDFQDARATITSFGKVEWEYK